MDHVKPLVTCGLPTGYITEIRNLVPCCSACNSAKGAQDFRAWYKSEKNIKRLHSEGLTDTEIDERFDIVSRYIDKIPAPIDYKTILGDNLWNEFLHRNATELIFKSIRENDSYTLSNDIEWLHRHDFLSTDEFEFLNDETGIRTLRNKMVHKDFYRYFIEIDGILYPFTEKETWNMLCEMIIPEILSIINNVISKKMDIASMGEE